MKETLMPLWSSSGLVPARRPLWTEAGPGGRPFPGLLDLLDEGRALPRLVLYVF